MATQDDILNSLKTLSALLYRHYGQKSVLLIDEYDVPLDKAFHHGYYREMVALIRGLFGQALKTNEYLQFAVLTGCLRVAKESIFTGLNVFFTLAAGLAFSMLCASRSERDGKWYAFAAVTLLYAAAVLPCSDYGFGGAALIFLLYICRQKRALQVAALWLWCLWQYALELGSWEMFAFAAAAAIPMLLYNGRRGPGLKWLFYGFYPAHLLILGLYACGIWPWAA